MTTPAQAASTLIPVDAALGKGNFYDIGALVSDEIGSAEMYYKLLNCGFRIAATSGREALPLPPLLTCTPILSESSMASSPSIRLLPLEAPLPPPLPEIEIRGTTSTPAFSIASAKRFITC